MMEKIDSRLIQTVILLDRQYLLLERLIKNQSYVLKNFEGALEKNEQALENVLDVYNYVFFLIDHLERFRKIALSIPKLNQKNSEFRALISAMGDLIEARNQIQHINNDVENDYVGPLLGSIFWINGLKQFNVIFHDIGRQRGAPGPILDTAKGKYSHAFCYVYNEKYYDLQKAVDGARRFNRWISTKIKIQIDGKEYNTREHFSAFSAEFRLPQNISNAE